MCVGKPKTPKVTPPPPPQAPNATPSLKNLTEGNQPGGIMIDPVTGRRKRGLASLRIDRQAPTTGLQIGKGD